jgi:hypothetical protein
MGARDDKIAKYLEENKKLSLGLSEDLITKVTVGLGPSIHKKDSETVSCSDNTELDRVKKNYLIKKLGCKESPQLDEAIKDVCTKMGSSNRNKYRALFYALLAQNFGKESVYA